MSLGSHRALLAAAGGGGGLGDEQWYMLDNITTSGDSVHKVTFTSSGSDDAWSNYRDLVFISAINSHSYSDTKVRVYVNNYDMSTSSNRQYYNLRQSNMVSGSGQNMEYSNINNGTGDQYNSNSPGMSSGYSGMWSTSRTAQALNVFTFWDINRTGYTKFYTFDCFPNKRSTSQSTQDFHAKIGVQAFHGPGYGSTPAITQVDFEHQETTNFGNCVFSCYGIKAE